MQSGLIKGNFTVDCLLVSREVRYTIGVIPGMYLYTTISFNLRHRNVSPIETLYLGLESDDGNLALNQSYGRDLP